VSRIVLHIYPDQDAERARRAFDSHLSRALSGCREKSTSICSDTAGLPRTNGQSQQPCDDFGSLLRPTYGSGKPGYPVQNCSFKGCGRALTSVSPSHARAASSLLSCSPGPISRGVVPRT
jgi:hypothetical protein